MRPLALLVAATLLGPGCALIQRPEGRHVGVFPDVVEVRAGSGVFRVHALPEEAEVVPELRTALTRAAERIAPWGEFTAPVDVKVYPDHASLEIALRRYDYPWLRAWARYDDIYLQSPSSWGVFEGGAANLTELLTHELTHCLMYQLAARRSSWLDRDRTIPIWFREGMASWTARQGHRRMSEARLARWMTESGRDPVGEARALYQHESGPVYAAAHWAFSFLVERYGAQRVRALLAAMHAGAGFDAAFRARIGLSREAFEADFHHYLAWEGWKDRVHPTPEALFDATRNLSATGAYFFTAHGGGRTGARSASRGWRWSSTSVMRVAGATVDTGTKPDSAPQ